MNPYVPSTREEGVLTQEEIKPGMIVYEVIVGPLKGFYRARQVREVSIQSFPYPGGLISASSMSVKIASMKEPEDFFARTEASLRDRAVTPADKFTAYNLNRWFGSKDQAQAYHDRINARNLMHLPPELEDTV